MSSRLYSRIIQLAAITVRLPLKLFRKKPDDTKVRRILVIHQLLLGDAIMSTALLASLREKYPKASIDVAMPDFLVPLYSQKPYQINPISYSPKNAKSLIKLIQQKSYDIGIVLGDARYSWAAYAAGTRWIITHTGDYPAYKNWFVDELLPMPESPKAMPDLMADLCAADHLTTFSTSDWIFEDVVITSPESPYIVFHLGASSVLKLWPVDSWLELGHKLKNNGFSIVVTCGPGEEALLEKFRGNGDFEQLVPGNFTLLQMRKLIAQSSLLVSPDTGISHLAKLTNTPLVCLFGPGPVELVGNSQFFNNHKARYLSNPIPCRDQPVIFKRPVSWVRFCERNTHQCQDPKCIKSLTVNNVYSASKELLKK
ncbi:glycosyltransferase family 9 protein [Endozoicomonas sp. ALB115]|uniref:glycosyltransferase family 9 protein n=1 Tax=Endozoicomonas sp. ALB115 TaxID=3403074 RepID=UPI003BB75591